jgi:peptidase E
LAGVSAGGACWFEGCITDSFGDLRPWRGGLGLLRGSFCPHLVGENRGPAYTDAVAAGILPGGYAADDGAAVHFVDGELRRVVAERPGATVLRVEPSNEPTTSGVLTEVLTPELV